LKYVVIKHWVTDERAELNEDQIRSELEAEMRHLIELSGQQMFFGYKSLPTDRGFWKFRRTHTDRRGIIYDVYRRPMRHQCLCKGQLPHCDLSRFYSAPAKWAA
jgi:hypothetical protein